MVFPKSSKLGFQVLSGKEILIEELAESRKAPEALLKRAWGIEEGNRWSGL
jgi:hypothetical protein